MLARHARAVFLVGGWLLLQPPLVRVSGPPPIASVECDYPGACPGRTPTPPDPRQTDSPLRFRIDGSIPVNRWHVLHAFDTAAECEKARSQGPLLWNRDERPRPKDLAPQHMWRCVPASHIYPPAK